MPLDKSRIQALCFDIDGTLHETDDQFVQKLALWLSPIRFLLPNRDPLPLARKLVMFTESPATYLYGQPDRFGLDDELAKIGDWYYRKRIGKSPRFTRLVEGVAEMLETLHQRYPLSIVSARGERSTHQFLDQFGIRHYFTAIASGQTCRYTKPHPDPVIWAGQQMHTPPSNCLMIGDTIVDILAGKAAGAQTVGVLCGLGTRDELERKGADLVLDSTNLLTNILID